MQLQSAGKTMPPGQNKAFNSGVLCAGATGTGAIAARMELGFVAPPRACRHTFAPAITYTICARNYSICMRNWECIMQITSSGCNWSLAYPVARWQFACAAPAPF